MKKKTLLTGMLVMVLVFGMTIVGCAGGPPVVSNQQVAGSWSNDIGDTTYTYIMVVKSTIVGDKMYDGTYSAKINDIVVETGYWFRFGKEVTFIIGDGQQDGGKQYKGTITGNTMTIRGTTYTKQ